jgi:S-adenosylmethionine:tRNA ribosyltransferase-isomerase
VEDSANDPASLRLADFEFDLPPEAIAQAPADRRDGARLLLVDRAGPLPPRDSAVVELPGLLGGDELLVYNDTRVVPARLLGHKATGGAVELLMLDLHRVDARELPAMGRSSKPLRGGAAIDVGGAVVEVTRAEGAGRYRVRLPDSAADWPSFLAAYGRMPLPPYIAREEGPTAADRQRYQTVFAAHPGAVAAPTAGLHFTEELLAAVRARGCETVAVTLHVGPGTFQPVRADRVVDHRMHAEVYEISGEAADAVARARDQGRPVLAVGTTVVRALEGAAQASPSGRPAPGRAATDIFILPGFRFRVVDQLMTNFHLPGSTLLMLVGAFAGRERVLAAYGAAVARGYRFYSYGDGMLLR